MLTEEKLKEIEERAAKATPGPLTISVSRGATFNNETDAQAIADAKFLAHAYQDVPDLVAEVRRLRDHPMLLTAVTPEGTIVRNVNDLPEEGFRALAEANDEVRKLRTVADAAVKLRPFLVAALKVDWDDALLNLGPDEVDTDVAWEEALKVVENTDDALYDEVGGSHDDALAYRALVKALRGTER